MDDLTVGANDHDVDSNSSTLVIVLEVELFGLVESVDLDIFCAWLIEGRKRKNENIKTANVSLRWTKYDFGTFIIVNFKVSKEFKTCT